MNARISLSLLIFAAVLVSTWFALKPQAAGSAPGASIPTFSTAEIGRQGHFYVGGHYAGEPGNETMHGAMYVETWVPKKIRHSYPIVIIGFSVGQDEYEFMQTPDGRPGWAYDFVNQGYTVYMMDFPATGRSAYVPGVDGTVPPPRSGPLMEEVWSGGRPPATPQSSWPQAKKYTQW